MKGWAGFALAMIVIFLAFFLKPHAVLEADASIYARLGFAGVFLCLACAAFMLGNEISELKFTRELTIWTAGIAVAVVAFVNFDLIWHKENPNDPAVAKTQTPTTTLKRKTKSNQIYVPDTAPINKVEKTVSRRSVDPLADDDKVLVKNHITEKDTKLDSNFKVSDEEKERFRKFLKAQGLKYNPDTAFKITPPDQQNEEE